MATAVKITDLTEYKEKNQIKKSDLVLKSSFLSNSHNLDTYSSNSLSTSVIVNDFFTKPRTITNTWNFVISANAPSIPFRVDTKEYIDYVLSNFENRKDAINLSGGYYTQRTFGDYDNEKSSLSVSQYSIANLDFINRLAAWIYDDIVSRISTVIEVKKQTSFVGQIIHSTTLSSKSLLKEKYGENTNWIQHVGYTLRGVNSDVSFNKLSADGGSNNNRTMPLIEHNHTIKHSHTTSWGNSGSFNGGNVLVNIDSGSGAHGGSRYDGASVGGQTYNAKASKSSTLTTDSVAIILKNASSGNVSLDIRQPYKNVYIWERIS